ncbi:MAG: helix-turn-helix domain-containing protein, partial [Deltaproteobacteria bacterium]|nr:helix-turn-helix domain-containing protein [Deltaproteobacteria bacterium]
MAEARTKGFGDRLRRAREEAGREVKDLAEVTRVQGRYIEALEQEDWSVV